MPTISGLCTGFYLGSVPREMVGGSLSGPGVPTASDRTYLMIYLYEVPDET